MCPTLFAPFSSWITARSETVFPLHRSRCAARRVLRRSQWGVSVVVSDNSRAVLRENHRSRLGTFPGASLRVGSFAALRMTDLLVVGMTERRGHTTQNGGRLGGGATPSDYRDAEDSSSTKRVYEHTISLRRATCGPTRTGCRRSASPCLPEPGSRSGPRSRSRYPVAGGPCHHD